MPYLFLFRLPPSERPPRYIGVTTRTLACVHFYSLSSYETNNMEHEIWLPIDFTNGVKEVSNLGRLRNAQTKFILKQFKSKGGYLRVTIWANGKYWPRNVHRIVANVFIEKITGKNEVNHKDFNKENNSVENLEWCTPKENRQHFYQNKFKGKISDDDVLFIRQKISDIGMMNLAKMFNVNAGYILNIVNGGCKGHIHKELIRKKKYSRPIPIIEYDLNGNESNRYTSASQASKMNNILIARIREVLTGEKPTYKGRVYKYQDPELAAKYERNRKESNLNQYDLDGNKVGSFLSVRDAAYKTGISKYLIRDVLVGKQRKTHGFVFKRA